MNTTRYQIDGGILEALACLASTNRDLYVRVIEHYISLDDPFRLHPVLLVDHLLKASGRDSTLPLVNKLRSTRHKWLFAFYSLLTETQVRIGDIDSILALYKEAEASDLDRHWDYLLTFKPFDELIFVHVGNVLQQRATQDKSFVRAFDLLFNPHTEANKQILELFKTDIKLLEQLYLLTEGSQHTDHDGKTLTRILDVDPGFIIEYIDWKYSNKEWLSRHDDSRDYSFIWMRDDSVKVMSAVIDHVFRKEQGRQSYFGSYIETFFVLRENAKNNPTITERQDRLLTTLVETRHDDLQFMRFVFNLATNFVEGRRHNLVKLFLQHNRKVEHFKKLPLESSSWSSHGSWVPVLQKRIDFFQSLLPLVTSVEFLQHRQLIENIIDSHRERMEREKKQDFMED